VLNRTAGIETADALSIEHIKLSLQNLDEIKFMDTEDRKYPAIDM
jgi:hypothetical protein